MSAPLIRIQALSKDYGAASPLRIESLDVDAADHVALAGLDTGAAEVLMHLITGAVLPDSGDVSIEGRATRDIATDTEWLQSLDRFGIVTERSVLFEELPVVASLALPLTLSIDPIPPEVRTEVDALADLVGLSAEQLAARASALAVPDRLRVHLARAIAHRPRMVLLERPTDAFEQRSDREAFGRTLREVSQARHFGWLAVTDDAIFAKAAGISHRRLDRARGTISASGWRWPWQGRS